MTAHHSPTPDDLRFAAEWLRAYDDSHDGGDQSAVAASVADWLDTQADNKQIRDAAREYGIPVGKLRAHITKLKGDTP